MYRRSASSSKTRRAWKSSQVAFVDGLCTPVQEGGSCGSLKDESPEMAPSVPTYGIEADAFRGPDDWLGRRHRVELTGLESVFSIISLSLSSVGSAYGVVGAGNHSTSQRERRDTLW